MASTKPTKADSAEPVESSDRFETFEAVRPDGVTVIVERNIETGEQSVTE